MGLLGATSVKGSVYVRACVSGMAWPGLVCFRLERTNWPSLYLCCILLVCHSASLAPSLGEGTWKKINGLELRGKGTRTLSLFLDLVWPRKPRALDCTVTGELCLVWSVLLARLFLCTTSSNGPSEYECAPCSSPRSLCQPRGVWSVCECSRFASVSVSQSSQPPSQ